MERDARGAALVSERYRLDADGASHTLKRLVEGTYVTVAYLDGKFA